MSQRMWNLAKWAFLAEGKGFFFKSPKVRTVVLDVNCPDWVRFYVIEQREDMEENPEYVTDKAAGRTDENRLADRLNAAGAELASDTGRAVTFVALCRGRDKIEFGVNGAFELMCEGGSAWIFTADSTQVETTVIAPVIFTKIANRRQRNPHLEMMEYQMKLNQKRMYDQLEHESARRIEALEKRMESYVAERRPGKAIDRPDQVESGEAGRRDPPAAPVGKAGKDEGKSEAGKPAAKQGKAARSGDDTGSSGSLV